MNGDTPTLATTALPKSALVVGGIAPYRGRLAPSPTGALHLGHARTFWMAQTRATERQGTMVLRIEDLDPDRSKPVWTEAILEDLHWFGFRWQEGPEIGGPYAPYVQSQRRRDYVEAFHRLHASGLIYACQCSRQDVQLAAQAPHQGDEEPIYGGPCRSDAALQDRARSYLPENDARPRHESSGRAQPRISWRFHVEAATGQAVTFCDGGFGPQSYLPGRDFGDFVIWRPDDVPAYQLAVVVDDSAMRISEVVRGADLLVSTARQLLIFRALGIAPPAFYHCPLVLDEQGVRLAKRHDSMSLRTLRAAGKNPEELRRGW